MAAILLGTAVAESPGHFPKVESSNLEGRVFHMPGDFEGTHNLLLIAFERHQQSDLDTWLHEMKRFEEIDSGFRYYELPTISKMNPVARWFINGGMRRGIPDKKARERTITLYIDKQPFEEALQIDSEKTVYAILVDREGNVLWRADGTYDETKGESLRQFLARAAK